MQTILELQFLQMPCDDAKLYSSRQSLLQSQVTHSLGETAMRIQSAIVLSLLLVASHSAFAQEAPAPKPHNFEKWEKEIAAYEEADKKDPPAKGGIVFTGSSTIRRW